MSIERGAFGKWYRGPLRVPPGEIAAKWRPPRPETWVPLTLAEIREAPMDRFGLDGRVVALVVWRECERRWFVYEARRGRKAYDELRYLAELLCGPPEAWKQTRLMDIWDHEDREAVLAALPPPSHNPDGSVRA